MIYEVTIEILRGKAQKLTYTKYVIASVDTIHDAAEKVQEDMTPFLTKDSRTRVIGCVPLTEEQVLYVINNNYQG